MRTRQPVAQARPARREWIDIVAAVCLLAGDTVGGYVFPSRWRPLGLSPIFWLGLALVAARQLTYWQKRHAGEGPLRLGFDRPLANRLILLVVLTRVGVLAAGLSASVAHPDEVMAHPHVSMNPIQNLPARWDSFWYLGIARQGYQWTADAPPDTQQSVAFFPAYPFLMKVGGDLVTVPAKLLRDPELFGSGVVRVLWGGVLASIACFTLAVVRVYRLALSDTRDAAAAFRACVLLSAYPFAIFFSVPYSESLALLSLVSLTMAWRDGKMGPGVAWGLVLGLCRSNGWTVAAALIADRFVSAPPAWRTRTSWVAVALSPVAGAAAYSAYLYHLSGNPFAWASAQRAWGVIVAPGAFLTRRWFLVQQNGLGEYLQGNSVDALTFLAVALMVAVAVWLAARREWLYAAVMLAYLAPAVAVDLPASGRMTALLFPAFVGLAPRLRGGRFIAVVTAFAVCQAWFAWRFFLWKTPY